VPKFLGDVDLLGSPVDELEATGLVFNLTDHPTARLDPIGVALHGSLNHPLSETPPGRHQHEFGVLGVARKGHTGPLSSNQALHHHSDLSRLNTMDFAVGLEGLCRSGGSAYANGMENLHEACGTQYSLKLPCERSLGAVFR
jgi:hypothetical protein